MERKSVSYIALVLFSLALAVLSVQTASAHESDPFFTPYKINYLSLFTVSNEEIDLWTIKYQVSFKVQLINAFNFSYTQLSKWDIGYPSAPFDETNYNPSLFFSWGSINDPFYVSENGRGLSGLEFGYEHQSNGRDETVDMNGISMSRSWERVFIEPVLSFNEHIHLRLKGWVPFYQDDNIDYTKTYGYGEVALRVVYGKIDFRITNRTGVERGYVMGELLYQLGDPNLCFYMQYFNGYGQYLRDIMPDGMGQESTTKFRAGISVGSGW